ncbi:MAG: tRNA pseudouridine(38-40) synthase TruA [Nitrospiraceae bacterium]|nr:MAG: tRNA pseudouridine(38-40) synthase TruA [Nitrospiraceae bacterium]
MRNIRLTLQYDGTRYAGWQVQKDRATIQGLLEEALFRITGENLRVTGASRTDAGVHALGQVAAFTTQSKLEPPVFLRALNAGLPEDIAVLDAAEEDDDFHPRYSALHKTYSYLIAGPGDCSLFLRKYAWVIPFRLDSGAMEEAACHMRGTKDFSSFRASGCSARNPVRSVTALEITRLPSFPFLTFSCRTPCIRITIRSQAFLRHMVRNIVGTLVDVGRGKMRPDMMSEILERRDRRAAGKTAPACGLFLEKIEY